MSFWNLNDSNEKIDNTGNFESGGDMDPIPAKTQVKAAIDEAKWDDYESEDYISLRWTVLAPEQYKNRKIFQKVKVNEPDTKKQDKAKKMLGAIAINAGGGLLKLKSAPSDQDLQKHLLNKPMVLLLQVWKLKDDNGEEKSGNWVSAVSPLAGKAKAEPVVEPQQEPEVNYDDEVGF